MLLCDWFLKYTASFATGIANAGNEVCLVCRSHATEFGDDYDERSVALEVARAAGVEVIEFPARMASGQRAASRAIRTARLWRSQIVHVQSATFEPRFFLTFGRRQPLLMTVHDPVPHEGARLRRRNQLIEHAWRRRSDCLVVHSTKLIADLGRVRQPVAVLAHGADVRAAPFPRPETASVLLFGRLEPYKGIDVLTAAMEHVWQARPDVRLLVYGRGASADDLPNDPRVESRLEYIRESEVDGLFARATLLVLPYTDASQSGVGAIAIAHGVPAIVSAVGGLSDLTLDDSFVVPPGDPHALASAILRHLDHDDHLRRRVLHLADEQLGWDAVGLAATDLYRNVLESRTR